MPCTGAAYDYYRYTEDGGKVGLMTAKEQCGSCLFNMKVEAFGTDEIIGQVGDTKFWEIMKDTFAISCAKGTSNADIVLLGIVVDDIKEDVAKDESRIGN